MLLRFHSSIQYLQNFILSNSEILCVGEFPKLYIFCLYFYKMLLIVLLFKAKMYVILENILYRLR